MTHITDRDAQKRLLKVADHLDLFPESHHQETWAMECGTKACIAGWLCILETDDFEWNGKGYFPKQETVDAAIKADGWTERDIEVNTKRCAEYFPDDKGMQRMQLLTMTEYFAVKGAELLGLDSDTAEERVFDAYMQPVGDLSTGEAIRRIAQGEEIESVWSNERRMPS